MTTRPQSAAAAPAQESEKTQTPRQQTKLRLDASETRSHSERCQGTRRLRSRAASGRRSTPGTGDHTGGARAPPRPLMANDGIPGRRAAAAAEEAAGSEEMSKLIEQYSEPQEGATKTRLSK